MFILIIMRALHSCLLLIFFFDIRFLVSTSTLSSINFHFIITFKRYLGSQESQIEDLFIINKRSLTCFRFSRFAKKNCVYACNWLIFCIPMSQQITIRGDTCFCICEQMVVVNKEYMNKTTVSICKIVSYIIF